MSESTSQSHHIPFELVEHLNRGDCVLFVGDALDTQIVGGSQSARLASALVDTCGAHCQFCKAGGKCLQPHNCTIPLTRAAQLYESRHNRHALVDFVTRRVDNTSPPSPIHHALTALPIRIIITTTYDDRLEAALRSAGRPYLSVMRDTDVPFDDPSRVQLIHLHGTVSQPDSLVLTEDDAADLFARLPTVTRILQAHFASKTLLFVGYRLSDPHFLALYRQVTGPIARHQRLAYAVQWPPDPLTVDRWRGKITLIETEPLPFLTELTRSVHVQAEEEMTDLDSLKNRLAQYKRKLVHIEKQESPFIAPRNVPFDLLENKRLVQARIEELEIQLAELEIQMSELGIHNPYTNRAMIRHAADFFGRRAELDRIYSLLANMQSVSIVGDRRIGKSSLLYCLGLPEVQQRSDCLPPSDAVFVYVDLLSGTQKTPEDFLRYLLKQLHFQVRNRVTFEVDNVADYERVEDVIVEINAAKLKPVFLLDEFDNVTRNQQFDWAFFGFLRSLASRYNLAIATASVKRLKKLCHTDIVSSPFFNIFHVIELGPFPKDEATSLIQEPAARAGVTFDDAEIDFVFDLAGCHPFLTQIACYYLFDTKVSGGAVDFEAIRYEFDTQAIDHFEYFWAHVSEEMRQRLITDIVRQDTSDFHYLAQSRGFRDFIQTRSNIKLSYVELTPEITEEALKKLDDLVALGEGLLGDHLGLLNDPKVERGKQVRSILIESVECLKPAGEPDYNSSAWWPYLILYERYVSGKPVTDIVKSFPFSRRQFYRELDRAIAALTRLLNSAT